MTLNEFYALVREEAKRGNTLDALIPSKVRQAARWLERKISFEEMKTTVEVICAAGATNISDWGSGLGSGSRIKELDGLKYFSSATAEFNHLTRVHEKDITALRTEPPQGYWTKGRFTAYFNSILDVSYTFQASLVVYSVWPTDGSASHYLMEMQETLLFSRTMMLLSPSMRDEKMLALHKGFIEEQLPDAFKEAEESEFADTDAQMHYGRVW